MTDEPRIGSLGMRGQIALALLGVLTLATTLAMVAIRPLTAAASRNTRRQAGVTLTRAVAGQVAMRPSSADLGELLHGTVGPGALSAAAVLDTRGALIARVGEFTLPLPAAPFEDRVLGDPNALEVTVLLPGRGAFVSEVSLAETATERTLFGAVLLYTAVASAAALWAVFVLLTRYTVRPVEALTRAAERVAAGRRDALAEPRGAREIVRAARAFNAMTSELVARELELSTRVHDLERTTRDLHAAQNHLVRSERLAVVGRLAAGIAHEVGNPLAAIVGLTDVLKEPGITEAESRDFADRIGREAQRIHRTVRELLDYARAAPGDAAGESAMGPSDAGDASEAVAQVERLLAPQKSMRGVSLAVARVEGIPKIALSTDRLVQVLLNLVLNASDAARAHGSEEPSISVRIAHANHRVVIEVEDNGPGIASELRQRVFEPFFTTKPAGEGTGLGLAICAVIVEQAGGEITALDRTDGHRGALLRVALPTVEV